MSDNSTTEITLAGLRRELQFSQARVRELEALLAEKTEEKKRKRVAVFGGSYNPITGGHLQVAAGIVHSGHADEVWIVPCGPRPDKKSLTTPARDRLLMCHLAVETTFGRDFPVRVDDEEIEEAWALSTPHLLSRYDEKYPDRTFLFAVGSDLLEGLHTWDSNYPGWEKTRGLVVLDRPGYEIPEVWRVAQNCFFVRPTEDMKKVVSTEISSSEIRNRYREMQSVAGGCSPGFMAEGLLPHTVLKFIAKNGMLGAVKTGIEINPLANPRTSSPTTNEKVKFGELKLTIDGPPKVAVFGGAFNPLHDCHIQMVAQVVHSGLVDEVWIVPCGPRPEFPELAPALDRYIMCQLGVLTQFSDEFPVYVLDTEVYLEHALTTPHLLEELKNQFPTHELHFLAGSNLLNSMSSWDSGRMGWELTTNIIVVERMGFPVDEEWKARSNVQLVESPLIQNDSPEKIITSNLDWSVVRARLVGNSTADWSPLEGLVPRAITSFIYRYGLFRNLTALPLADMERQGSLGTEEQPPSLFYQASFMPPTSSRATLGDSSRKRVVSLLPSTTSKKVRLTMASSEHDQILPT
jgi:nicotinate (nicotinamide) nucleotide adenylyltransferase